jgi:hypothetical protein
MAKKPTESRRKLVEFDAQTWHALNLLSRESMKPFRSSLMSRSAIYCKSEGRPIDLKAAAAGQREGFRKTASEGKPIMWCAVAMTAVKRCVAGRKQF